METSSRPGLFSKILQKNIFSSDSSAQLSKPLDLKMEHKINEIYQKNDSIQENFSNVKEISTQTNNNENQTDIIPVQQFQQSSKLSDSNNLNIVEKIKQAQQQKIVLSKLQFPEIFQDNFFTYLVGPPGSGKSTLLNELICNDYLYGKYFNKYFFVSPHKFCELQKEGINWTKNLELQTIFQFIQDANNSKQPGRVCLVLDDVISQISSLQKDKLMCGLILNRRHLVSSEENNFSVFVTSQKYNMLPLKFRVQITSALLFYVCPKEWQDIRQEIVKHQDLKQVQRVIEKECNGPHKFIYIHNTNPMKLYDSQFKQIVLF